MQKNNLKKLVSSITAPHLDLEQSQMLKAKEDIDEKLEKILKLIDNEKDGNSEDQSKLISFIETLYHSYIFVYGRYDQLIGKIKKSIKDNKEDMNGWYADSISSWETSDSESSEFYKSKESETNGVMCAKGKEEDLAAKLAKREAACLSLEKEMQSTREMIKVLEDENASRRLVSNREENEALISENSMLLETLYDTKNSIKELKVEKQALKDEVAKLKNKNNGEGMDAIASILNKTDEESNEIKKEYERLQEENSSLQKTVTELHCQKSDLERLLEVKGEEASAIAEELEEKRIEASSDIRLMASTTNDLKIELDVLRSQENELEEQITGNSSTGESSDEKSESKSSSKLSFQERMLNRQKHRFDRLFARYKLLEAKDERIHQLEKEVEEKKVEIVMFEDKEQELLEKLKLSEAQKAKVDCEIGKLHELIQTLEVHLRLTNQKFKVTKSEYKEKDELHKRKMKEIQGKCGELEERNKDMHEEINYMDYELNQIKEDTEMALTTLTNAFHNLELVFEEACGHSKSRLFECSEDLRVLKDSLRTVMSSKRELEQNAKLAGDLKKRISELEKIVRQKEEEGKLKDEEKRAAIRQLCLQIDYHRENCKYLLQERAKSLHGIRKPRQES